MIQIRVTVKGELDAPAFTRVFAYLSSDEEIFAGSVAVVQDKLERKMKINVNEALIIYCDFVAKSIRAGMPDSKIQDEAAGILSVDKVMVGVPETLRTAMFEAVIDNMPARNITVKELIPASEYIMAG